MSNFKSDGSQLLAFLGAFSAPRARDGTVESGAFERVRGIEPLS